MTENDIKTICEKIDSLHAKILKSNFAETVTESEMIALILAVEKLNGKQAEDVPDINVGHKWISVKDRLPTHEDGKVLICTAYGISIAKKTTTNHWKGDNAIPKLITHWMPLPEPPTEKENK